MTFESQSLSSIPVILVTGMSGAGRSCTLKTLEDLGYETVDNLPLSLLGLFIQSTQDLPHPVAIGLDVRAHDFRVDFFLQQVQRLSTSEGLSLEVVFCDCDDEILARRYTETRRRHPLADDRPALEGIRVERQLLQPIRELATYILDTTQLSTADTRHLLNQKFRAMENKTPLYVQVMSFGFKRGIPREADQIYDVRFLKNPFYQPSLKVQTGQDLGVGTFLQKDPYLQPFLESVFTQMKLVIPRFEEEGRSYYIIAFGCTGGQHRSVYCAEQLVKELGKRGQPVTLKHRDLGYAIKKSDERKKRSVQG